MLSKINLSLNTIFVTCIHWSIMHTGTCSDCHSSDIANFDCNKTSPIDTANWSDTQPQVALTHIFCGQINQKGKAEGYHSRPNNRDPVCARANNLVPNTYPLKCYKKVEVREYIDGLRDKWIARDPGTYCFFPLAWNITETVNIFVDIYNQCQRRHDHDKICYQNYLHPDGGTFGIVLFIAQRDGQEVINSAFPVPKSMTRNMPCSKYC